MFESESYGFDCLNDFGSGMCLDFLYSICGSLVGSILVSFATLFINFGVQIVLGGAPRREGSEERGREQNAQESETTGQKAPKWDPKIARLVVLTMICSKLFPHHFLNEFVMLLLMFFVSICTYISCFIWMPSGIF